jgi:hypothetical protein
MLQEGSFASQTRRPIFSLEAIPPSSERFCRSFSSAPTVGMDGRRFARADTTRESPEAQDTLELRDSRLTGAIQTEEKECFWLAKPGWLGLFSYC